MVDGLRFKTARQLFAACPTAAGDMLAVPDDRPSVAFCRALLAGRTPEEAISFCACMLPTRAAVWWGHECLGNLGDLLDEQDHGLLAEVQAWVGGSDAWFGEDEAIERRTSAGWIALAARNGPQDEAARAVATGILMGLARVALDDRRSVLADFVEMGIALAEAEALQQA
ncbi:hypothetical protein PV773_09370 [Mesorhizobium sp. CC13]|uniref:DUF6931 family protein n=1 Tax=Mesorhizobium sp. CC13 TaxID=3029194 RepID=UPI0032672DD4